VSACVVVAVLLVAALAVIVAGARSERDTASAGAPATDPLGGATTTAPADPGTTAPTPPPAPSSSIPPTTAAPPPVQGDPLPEDPALRAPAAEAEAFIARDRGHPFAAAVRVASLPDDDFTARVLGQQDRSALAAEGQLLKLEGLIPLDDDYAETESTFIATHTAAQYEPENHEVVVRRQQPDLALEGTLVHELTHALDDQLFGLSRPQYGRDTGSEIRFGFQCLTEGDAMRVADDWVHQLTPGERQIYDTDGGRQPDSTGLGHASTDPKAGVDAVAAKYDWGEPLVEHEVAVGGNAEVDRDFVDPPTTSEQVMHPDKYTAREPAAHLDLPEVGGTITGQGVTGELTTRDLLAVVADPVVAADAAAGWGADRWATWVQSQGSGPAETCLRDDYVMDTPADVGPLASAYRQWADAAPGRQVTQPDPSRVEVTMCAVIPAASKGPSPA
jgi:hypothetical protein